MRAVPWTRGDLLVAGGATIAIAATADTAHSLYDRFAVDLAGLSALERIGVALWDFRPLAPAVFAAGALAVVAGLAEPPGRLSRLNEHARPPLAALCSAHAVLGAVVLTLAVWLALAGSVGGDDDELGFLFGAGERAVTLVTQVLAWAPLVGLVAVLALRATEPAGRADAGGPAPERPRVSEEMEALWHERLAFGPKRERARNLLGRIRALEEAGDDQSARELADEMRKL